MDLPLGQSWTFFSHRLVWGLAINSGYVRNHGACSGEQGRRRRVLLGGSVGLWICARWSKHQALDAEAARGS